MSTQVDLRRLSPTRLAFVIGFERAYRLAGQDYRQELAILGEAYRQEMAKLAASYDQELKSLADDFAALARAHHEEMLRRAVAEAVAERAENPFRPLH